MSGARWFSRTWKQMIGQSPFEGDIRPTRIPLYSPFSGRPTLPFPHPWNYQQPLRILETFFHEADGGESSGKHNRYLDILGFAPVFVTRDPGVIRAITTATGDKPGQFDRDTLPSTGIARATGKDTLLFSNGVEWKRQRKLSASPFGKTSLFQPEVFHEFAETFRQTVTERLEILHQRLAESGASKLRVQLEPEIKAVMLELLTNNFFGTEIPYVDLRNRFVPALERVIDHIVSDTVWNRLGIPIRKMPAFTAGIAQAKRDDADFEDLTTLVLDARKTNRGHWKQFKSDSPDEALRSNIKVFLAGALEATTSYAAWTLSHLAYDPVAQDHVYSEVKEMTDYSPENLEQAKYFTNVLEETLRLTPSLYFLPRRATADTWIETSDGRKLLLPSGTHILLDIWHANRHEDHWGIEKSGSPATEFVPERWSELAKRGGSSKDNLHFGFGHGPRVCPGKHLGQLEVALAVGAFVKLFRFQAVESKLDAKAGVSTKPADGVLIDLELR